MLVIRALGVATARLSRLTWALCLFAVMNFFIGSVLIERLPSWPPRPPRRPPVVHVDPRTYGSDSWRPMLLASDYVHTVPGGRVYQHILYDEGLKFQYPPPSLLAVDMVRALAGRFDPGFALNAISLVAALLTSVLVALTFMESLHQHRSPGDPAPGLLQTAVLGALAVGLALTFYPLVRAVAAGQIQAWLNAVAAAVLWLYMRGHDIPAGVGAAILALVKPHYGVLLLWSLLRRRRAFAIALVGTVVPVMVGSIAAYGFQNHRDYLTVVSLMGQHGEAYHPNQSMNGLLNRALRDVDSLTSTPGAFPEFHSLVFAGTLVGAILLLGIALWPPRSGQGAAGRSVDLSLMLLAVTMASPIAWEHHYGVLAPIFAASLPALLRFRVFGSATLPLAAVSYVLASNLLFGLTVGSAGRLLNLGQSHLFFAALIMLVALQRLRARLDGGDAGAGRQAKTGAGSRSSSLSPIGSRLPMMRHRGESGAPFQEGSHDPLHEHTPIATS